MVRAAVAAVMLGALSACGFRPLYGTSHPYMPYLETIKIQPISDRIGQQLRNMLSDRLTPKGVPARPLYSLEVTVTKKKQNVSIQKDQTITRARLIVRAQFRLRAFPSGAVLSRGVSRAITSYDVVQSFFATQVAAADATRRALALVSDDITVKLSFYFTRLKPAAQTRAQP